MNPLFTKLNLRDQASIVVLDAPPSMDAALASLSGVTVHRELPQGATASFAIAFAVTQRQLDDVSANLASACIGDAVLWIAYPKKSSRKFRCEFDRDSGWRVLSDAGFEGVRMVAIDEDWSALRFRRVQFVKTLSRSPERIGTAAGRARRLAGG